jgi:hypothetical protein
LCLSVNDMLRLKKLAATVRETVAKLMEDETQNVLIYARSLPPQQFYTQVDPPRKVITDAEAGKPRRKW